MDGKMVEAIGGRPNGNGCSRVSYSEIVHGVVDHEQLSRDDQVGFKAVDLMLGELVKDPAFAENFKGKHGLTVNDRSRLTNRSDSNYRKDILWSVHNPEDLFCSVIYCSNEILDVNKHIQDWGRRLLTVATSQNGEDDEITRDARKLVGDLMLKEQAHFDIDLVTREPFAAAS